MSIGEVALAVATGAAAGRVVTHGHEDGVQRGEGAGEPEAGEGEELAVDDRATEREAEPLVVVLRAQSKTVSV